MVQRITKVGTRPQAGAKIKIVTGPDKDKNFIKLDDSQDNVYDPNKENEYNYIRDFSNKLIDKALELEGTITGEHGIGLQKKEYLLKEHSDNIPLMKLIKKSFDPNNILNPGKIFDI